MPSIVAEIRRDACPACDCKADPTDPCAACPRGSWGPWMRCLPDQPVPAAPSQMPAPALRGGVIGPGTALKEMLALVGLYSGQDCKCDSRARTMDEQGPEWCERNMDLIVGWLAEEAKRRRLPFMPSAARFLLRAAIAKARRSLKRNGGNPR